MPLSRLWVRNYRSLMEIDLPLGPLTVVVGENGSGKTNLYRALFLLRAGARGELARTLLDEGGMPSIVWAGLRAATHGKVPPLRVVFGVTIDELSYELALGLPPPHDLNPFPLDPEIKEEVAWVGPKRTPRSIIADRAGSTATVTDVDGPRDRMVAVLAKNDTLLGQLGDPTRYPELYSLRHRCSHWRFYHHFPTDLAAPARWPRPGVRTTLLADDGSDLAAALATIEEIGDIDLLHEAVSEAFEGSDLAIAREGGRFAVELTQRGLSRPVTGPELSDGTLRFLYLAAALLSPRPPELLVLNEPETSLHGPVLDPLARLIAAGADGSQLIVTTHSERLADRVRDLTGGDLVRLSRSSTGATVASFDA